MYIEFAELQTWDEHNLICLKLTKKFCLIVCQIETSEGVSNIEEISEVDGIDMLFIWEWISLNKFGQFNDPVF